MPKAIRMPASRTSVSRTSAATLSSATCAGSPIEFTDAMVDESAAQVTAANGPVARASAGGGEASGAVRDAAFVRGGGRGQHVAHAVGPELLGIGAEVAVEPARA